MKPKNSLTMKNKKSSLTVTSASTDLQLRLRTPRTSRCSLSFAKPT